MKISSFENSKTGLVDWAQKRSTGAEKPSIRTFSNSQICNLLVEVANLPIYKNFLNHLPERIVE
jgi:hypothetical protein